MKIDLNLFVVFEAIYCEGNITKAAAVLNLSQPAVSHSLNKLREHFNDPLFVRRGHQMQPTSVANNVIKEVRGALLQLKTTVGRSRQFIPLTSEQHFTLSLHGALEPIYLPPLIERLAELGPNVQLQSRRRVARSELEAKLASGNIDLAMDTLIPVGSNVKYQQIEQSPLVVLARKDHPALGQGLTIDGYLAQEHVMVSSRSKGTSVEDFELARLGLQRKISLRAQHALSACRVIAHNNMLLTTTEITAKLYVEILGLMVYPMPVSLPQVDVYLYWHNSVDLDPANQWLRSLLLTRLY